MKSFDKNGIQFAFDSTTIKVGQACLRKYQYKIIDGWQSLEQSPHLWFGSIYAKALETFHKLRAEGLDIEEATLKVVTDALVSSWEYETDEHGNVVGGAPYQSTDNNKTRDTLIRSIIWYLDYFREDNMTTFIDSHGKAAVEYSFSINVDDGLIFCGHIDRLVEYQGALMVQDQKTTKSALGSYYFNQYAPDTQMSMYTFAGKMIYSAPVKGVVIDAAQVMVGFTRFERGITYRTDSQLNEWYDDTMWHVSRIQQATREQHFPMNPSACSEYGGCEFRKICSLSPDVRQQFLLGAFRKAKRWDPLERR